MRRGVNLLPLVLAFALAAHAADKTQSCADCHKAEAQTQAATLMGHALLVPGGNTVLASHPQLSVVARTVFVQGRDE